MRVTVDNCKRWTCVAALALVACVALAACGSSATTTTSSAPASAATSAAATSAPASPIKIGLVAAGTGLTAQPAVYPDAEVGARAVNAAGGIMGRPIQIDYCDDQSNVQTADVCAQKLLVQDKDLMLVGDDGVYDTGVIPVLQSAHTILFSGAGASLSDYTSPNVFLIEPQIAAYNVLPQMVPSGQRVADFATDLAVVVKDASLDVPLWEARKNTIKVIPVPLSSAAFATPCLQAKQMHANIGIVLFNAPTQFAPMVQACKSLGVNLTWMMEGAVLAPDVVQTMNTLHLKTVIDLPYTPEAYTDFMADSAKYGPTSGTSTNDDPFDAYVGMKLLPEVLEGAGTTTDVAKIQAWLASQAAFTTDGWTRPINFTPANHPFGPSLASVKNSCLYKYVEQGGKLVPDGSTAFCG